MDWQRARSDEKKDERKAAICAAAMRLFKKSSYEKVTLNGIAVEAGFAKSNLYRYFSSREEIFLSIFSGLFSQWFSAWSKRLKRFGENEPVPNFAESWVKSFLANPVFLDLTPVLFVSLERNSSYEQLAEFKRHSKDVLCELSLEINRIYPELSNEQAFQCLSLNFAATSNYWAAATHNDALKKIYSQEEFAPLRPDFESDLRSAVEITVHGLLSIAKQGN
ncbi:MAG: TetR/AcrR family transcriptional regulator [Myxococcales bacterium]|nr:TetR/AcrR family transcriptional regulator [Myxococcales bacterium]